jgi:hypothetical protein
MGQPAAAERSRRPWLALFVLCLGTFAILLDTTIVNTALPGVLNTGRQLGATLGGAITGAVLASQLAAASPRCVPPSPSPWPSCWPARQPACCCAAARHPRPPRSRPQHSQRKPCRLPQPTDTQRIT